MLFYIYITLLEVSGFIDYLFSYLHFLFTFLPNKVHPNLHIYVLFATFFLRTLGPSIPVGHIYI